MRRCNLVVLLLTITLSYGCGTTKNSYRPPDESVAPVAQLKNTWIRNGSFDWEGFILLAVNDKHVSYGWSDGRNSINKITPGIQKLLVSSKFNRSFSGPCPCEGFADLEFDFAENKIYKLAGQIKGSEIHFWIVDSETESRLSDVVTTKFAPAASDGFIPIFIPAN